MRLPNGYGSIVKMKGNRRKPFRVRVCVPDGEGNKIRKTLATTKTYKEAVEILENYNKDPWSLENESIKTNDVFDLWLKDNNLAETTVRSYTSKYNLYCRDTIGDMEYKDLRTSHFKGIIDEYTASNATKNNMRKLFRQLDRVAEKYDIIKKGYSRYIDTLPEDSKEKVPFSEEEIEKLWDNVEMKDVDLVLILIYTGFRRTEFINIKINDIDFKNDTIKGGSKTEAGKNRLVPIHPRIKPLIIDMVVRSDDERLFPYASNTLSERFRAVMKKLDMKHSPHECRHTMATRLDNYGANRVSIDRIMGHSSGSIGEKVYTHKTINQLKAAVLLLP